MRSHEPFLHLARTKRMFLTLQRTGRSDKSVWALLGTEMFFRSPARRLLEYAAWCVLRVVSPTTAVRVSVGVSQIQVRHWMSLGHLSPNSGVAQALRQFLSLEANYDVAFSFLAHNMPGEGRAPQSLAAAYVGEARFYYMRILEQHLLAAHEVGRLAKRTPVRPTP
jgi:hypothetical protein